MKLYYLVTQPGQHGVLFPKAVKDRLPDFIQPLVEEVTEELIASSPRTMLWSFMSHECVFDILMSFKAIKQRLESEKQ